MDETIWLLPIIGGIIALIFYFSNKAKKKDPPPAPETVNPVITDSLDKPTASTFSGRLKKFKSSSMYSVKLPTQESLDALYAKGHNMWVCPYCETLNDDGAKQCTACGTKR